MNTGLLTFWIRQLGLMHHLDKLKYWLVKTKNASKNNQFLQNHPNIVLPPDYILFESFKMDYEKYFVGGQKSATWVKEQIQPYIPIEQVKILDWGCGPARILRHLPTLFDAKSQFFGTDYNENTIQWCQNHLKNIHFAKNDLHPPLAYEAHFFNAIYGISIFTHLSETNHRLWFDELCRVLKQGGILLLTTHGTVFKAIMTDSEKQQFDNQQLVIRDKAIEGHRVFTTFHPPTFMKILFEIHCDVLAHQIGIKESWGLNQDVWILRKK
jgi:ubiquinone/menaquinone biosynthesis C-methylase UbiE